jgi:hypothetical protein
MTKEIKFTVERSMFYRGKNGYGIQTGMEIYTAKDRIEIYPTNTKGWTHSCKIDVPMESIPALIDALKEAMRFNGNLGE